MIYAKIHNYTDSLGVAETTISTCVEQPDSTWTEYNVPDYTWLAMQGGQIITVSPVDNAQWIAFQAQASNALKESDITMHRIAEAVILGKTSLTAVDVVAWVQWRQALRTILSQTQPVTIPVLPTKPPYPAGT